MFGVTLSRQPPMYSVYSRSSNTTRTETTSPITHSDYARHVCLGIRLHVRCLNPHFGDISSTFCLFPSSIQCENVSVNANRWQLHPQRCVLRHMKPISRRLNIVTFFFFFAFSLSLEVRHRTNPASKHGSAE